jgi:hypothetical protein
MTISLKRKARVLLAAAGLGVTAIASDGPGPPSTGNFLSPRRAADAGVKMPRRQESQSRDGGALGSSREVDKKRADKAALKRLTDGLRISGNLMMRTETKPDGGKPDEE